MRIKLGRIEKGMKKTRPTIVVVQIKNRFYEKSAGFGWSCMPVIVVVVDGWCIPPTTGRDGTKIKRKEILERFLLGKASVFLNCHWKNAIAAGSLVFFRYTKNGVFIENVHEIDWKKKKKKRKKVVTSIVMGGAWNWLKRNREKGKETFGIESTGILVIREKRKSADIIQVGEWSSLRKYGRLDNQV